MSLLLSVLGFRLGKYYQFKGIKKVKGVMIVELDEL